MAAPVRNSSTNGAAASTALEMAGVICSISFCRVGMNLLSPSNTVFAIGLRATSSPCFIT